MWVFPLVIYYAMTLGVPIVNGSFYRAGFWEHFGFVIALPLIIVAASNVLMFLLRAKTRTAGPCAHNIPHTPRYHAARLYDEG